MKKHLQLLKIFFIFFLVFSWLFAGWPYVGKSPQFPPKVSKSKAYTTTFTTSGSWQAPAGVTSVTVEAWGSGGGGGGRNTNGAAGGGGGGAYAKAVVTVSPGNTYSYTIGAVGGGGAGAANGGDGGDSIWDAGSVVKAAGGKGGNQTTAHGAGGATANSVGTTLHKGGDGGDGTAGSFSGGGGAAGDPAADGNNASGQTGGGFGQDGGAGANGIASQGNGVAGSIFGGGGSGALRTSSSTRTGGSGALGAIRISYSSTTTISMQAGYYIGDGSTSHAISGLGFAPDFVLIKSDTTAGAAAFKTSLMPSANMAVVTATADNTASNLVLNSDGFTVGNSASVNSSGVRYTWIAFAGSNCTSSGAFCVGQYVGTGATTRTIPSGFQPNFVMVKRTTAVAAHFHTASEPTNETLYMINTVRDQTGNFIASFGSSGFNVGATDNASTGVYNYVAFKDAAGVFTEGTYAGNATDNRNITGVGFVPDIVLVKNATNATANNTIPVMNTPSSYGDYTTNLTATANGVDQIQARQSDGFQVGTSVLVNGTGDTYYYLAFAGVPSPGGSSGTFTMATGSYSGTGATQSITGIGFQPDVVIVKDNAANYAAFRTSLMKGDSTAYMSNAVANFTTGITSLDSDGFSLGASTVVNTNTNTYQYIAFGNAWNPESKSGASDFTIGAYMGNGIDSRNITGLPWQPNFVAIKKNSTSAGVWRTSALSGDLSSFFGATAEVADYVQALNSDGFQVGTNTAVNAVAGLNYWFAFKTGTNFVVNTYSGTSSSQNITSVGFQPDLTWVKRSTAVAGILRTSTLAGDNTQFFPNTANGAGRITGLLSSGFSVGTQTEANANGATYRYAAWRNPIAVSISTDGSVSYGILQTNTQKDTTASGLNDTQTITNNGSIAEDLTIKGQNTACPWTLASSVGTDQYKHEFSTDSGNNWTALTTNYQTLATNIATNGTQNFDLRITTPTSSSCFTQQAVNVTVQAVTH